MKLAFDIGANVGDMTEVLLRHAETVVAFEPNPNLVSALERRFAGKSVIVDRRGLSDKEGKETFMISDGSGLSTFSQNWVNNSRFADTQFWNIRIDTIVTTLDQAIADYGIPDYVKIDVEGYEQEVICGLSKLLPNTVFCFEWVEECPSDIFGCISHASALGYNAFARLDNDAIELKENIPWVSLEYLKIHFAGLDPERKEMWGMVYFMKDIPLVTLPESVIEDEIFVSYVNLDSRTDRNEHMMTELSRMNIIATRTRGLLPAEVDQPPQKLWVMQNRTPGAIGCWYSQVSIMEEGLRRKQPTIVLEDDIIFCDDFMERLSMSIDFLSTRPWDIFWLGGTYHLEPTWHKSVNGVHTHPDMQMCTCNLNKDWEPTENPNFVKTFGIWSTFGYLVNKNSLEKILSRLDNNVYRSQGIDHCMIMLQPQLNTFAFNPGCIRQMDNQSNIGNGITYFSGFESLGEHWYKQKL